jgi:phosphoribosylamine--glycine ligase
MGAIAPVTIPPATLQACHDTLQRAVRGMAAAGTPFRGVLYGGFMLTEQGPKLLEFNVRFGDPECQPLMTLWAEDPAPWLLGAASGRLPGEKLHISDQNACCVVVSAAGYPEAPANAPIEALPEESEDLRVFLAGTALREGRLWATGGRVLGVTGLGPTAQAARNRAYGAVRQVRFAGAAWRIDIGVAPGQTGG